MYLAFVHYRHVLSESMLFSVSSRILLSRTRLRVLPWFIPFLCPFFPFCFYPSSSRPDDLASVHGVSLSDSFFTLSSDAVAIIMIAINDTCAESSVVQ